jgi:hypothetical protein
MSVASPAMGLQTNSAAPAPTATTSGWTNPTVFYIAQLLLFHNLDTLTAMGLLLEVSILTQIVLVLDVTFLAIFVMAQAILIVGLVLQGILCLMI